MTDDTNTSHHDESMFSVDSWVKSWNDGQWGFHCKKVNELADKGHHVVGVDCASRAAVDFFAENQIEYTTSSQVTGMDICTLYKSKNGRIEFYVCDFFMLNKEVTGQFDVIWDRGSLNSMPLTKSAKYVQHINQFMKSGTRTLLDLFECYDDKGEMMKDMGLCEDDVKRLYDNCSFEVLGTYKYSDIEKDMSMDTEQKESFNKLMEEETRKAAADNDAPAQESSHGHDMFKDMIGKTYLLVVK